MEVGFKLRLASAEDHRRLITCLSPHHFQTRNEIHFFDGAVQELSSRRAVLRLRFFDDDSRCVVSLKAKALLVNGGSRVEEDEEDLDPKAGRDCVADPGKLDLLDSRLVRSVKEKYGLPDEKGFAYLGGYENVKSAHECKVLKLEVDETKYAFGSLYEIECESTDPEGAKRVLEDLLKENGISYWHCEMSKLEIFRSGKLPCPLGHVQVELAGLLDTVQETETKMVKMSELNHLMSTHVLLQAQQIKHLYEQAVETTKNVELGNKELYQAIQRNSSSRTFLVLFLFVLIFSILFLGWSYSCDR